MGNEWYPTVGSLTFHLSCQFSQISVQQESSFYQTYHTVRLCTDKLTAEKSLYQVLRELGIINPAWLAVRLRELSV